MIDLHTHTNCSDGLNTPNELLIKAQTVGLTVLSITDHNNCLAYEQMDRSLFLGRIVAGCEMATSFEGTIIEVLGYGVDTKIINDWFMNFYSAEQLKKNEESLFQIICDRCRQIGLTISKDLHMKKVEKGISKKTIYQDLLLYPENASLLPNGLLSSYREFFRGGLSNPNSPIFASEHLFYPSLQETMELIRLAGGLCFLAHLFAYEVENHMGFLTRFLEKAKPDGVECFHSCFSPEQEKELFSFAKNHSLMVSGGSDDHGKPNGVSIGRVRPNAPIEMTDGMQWLQNIPSY